MLRPQLRSTLFPYTTLFRSPTKPEAEDVPEFAGVSVPGWPRGRVPSPPSSSEPAGHTYAGELDRKSTRLNSSHRTISYAVFCLKKKKNKINYQKQYNTRISY